MKKKGVIHGRFQPFHNDHLTYVLEGLKKVDYLYIGITNPDPVHTMDDDADVKRSQLFANPCMFFERMEMVQNCLSDLQIGNDRFCIVPFPINIPTLWKYYVPLQSTFFLTIYDDWGAKKLRLLQESGLQVDILWRRPESEKGISASEIRNGIIHDEPWRHLVPDGTLRVMDEYKIAERVKTIYANLSNYVK